MPKNTQWKIIVTAVLYAALGVARAHHSFFAEFDEEMQGTLEGIVTQVHWANPHVRYELAVTSDVGHTQSWELQTVPTTILTRSGWTHETVSVGDAITAHGSLARRGLAKLYLSSIDLENGERIVPRITDDEVPGSAEADARRYGPSSNEYPFDIAGTWRNNYHWEFTVDDLDPKPTPFTDEGRRRYEGVQFGDDPALRCVSVGLPRLFGGPNPMEVTDVGPYYLFVFEMAGNAVRRIFMDGREAPPDWPLSMNGFSTGRWEDASLVIETTHLAPGWLDGSGLPYSGRETRLVETYTPGEDALTMDRTMVIHDPLYTEPLVRTRGSARADVDVMERLCDPDSFFQDLINKGLLEDYLQRERL